MKPAAGPRSDPRADRMLHLDPAADRFADARVADLPRLLRAGDLLVVNDGATLPGSLHGQTADGAPIEARLVQWLGGGEHGDKHGSERGGEDRSADDDENVRFTALLFGAGDHRTPTEHRPAPPRLPEGAVLDLGPELDAVIERVWPASARLVDLRFRARPARLWAALYRHGRPIQYAYVPAPLELWDTQTRYAARPVCAEMPSAGRPLTWELLFALHQRGVEIASLTHAAGISSTGEAALDALLPLPERYEIPESTARAVRATREAGGRVIAVGTTAARALEGSAAQHGGVVTAGAGTTDLVIRRETPLRVVDGLLTGMHGPPESHYQMLEALAPSDLLRRAHEHAEAAGYLAHEFGDATLILAI